jgi:hypothetical protein
MHGLGDEINQKAWDALIKENAILAAALTESAAKVLALQAQVKALNAQLESNRMTDTKLILGKLNVAFEAHERARKLRGQLDLSSPQAFCADEESKIKVHLASLRLLYPGDLEALSRCLFGNIYTAYFAVLLKLDEAVFPKDTLKEYVARSLEGIISKQQAYDASDAFGHPAVKFILSVLSRKDEDVLALRDGEVQSLLTCFTPGRTIPDEFFDESSLYHAKAQITLLQVIAGCQKILYWGEETQACLAFIRNDLPAMSIGDTDKLSGKSENMIRLIIYHSMSTWSLVELEGVLDKIKDFKSSPLGDPQGKIIRALAAGFLPTILYRYNNDTLLSEYNNQKIANSPKFINSKNCLAYYFSRCFSLDLNDELRAEISGSLMVNLNQKSDFSELTLTGNKGALLEMDFWVSVFVGVNDPLVRLHWDACILQGVDRYEHCRLLLRQLEKLPQEEALTFAIQYVGQFCLSSVHLNAAHDSTAHPIDLPTVPGLQTFIRRMGLIDKFELEDTNAAVKSCQDLWVKVNKGAADCSLLNKLRRLLAQDSVSIELEGLLEELQSVATIVFNRIHVINNPRVGGKRAWFLLYAMTVLSEKNGMRFPVIENLGEIGASISIRDTHAQNARLIEAGQAASSSADAARDNASGQALVAGCGLCLEMKDRQQRAASGVPTPAAPVPAR